LNLFSIIVGAFPFTHYISFNILRQIIEINTPKCKQMNPSHIGISSKNETKCLQVHYKGIVLHLQHLILEISRVCTRQCLFPSHSNKNTVYSITGWVRRKDCLDLQFVEYLHSTSKIFSLTVFLH